MLLIDDIPLFNWSRDENIDSKFLPIARISFITRLSFQVLNIFVVGKVNGIVSFLPVD